MPRASVIWALAALTVCHLIGGSVSSWSIDRSTEEFLRLNAGFGDRELAAARSGQRVVKTLDPGIVQEMVTAGVTRFQIPFDYYVDRALRGDLYRRGSTLLQVGSFSANPSVEDLAGLTLGASDLAPIGEVESSAGQSERAAKEFLVRLVRGFQHEGIRSLEPLRQGSKKRPVAQEVRTLLSNSPYLRYYGPNLEEYFEQYPVADGQGAREHFTWAKVNIGLRNLVRLTKVTIWVQVRGSAREALIVNQQIYASRYFQASLQVDHLIAEDSGPGTPATCLVTINRGRSDLLESRIARLLRPLILSRTRASTERTLDEAKLKLEAEYRQN